VQEAISNVVPTPTTETGVRLLIISTYMVSKQKVRGDSMGFYRVRFTVSD
jgi:hypothetical protein